MARGSKAAIAFAAFLLFLGWSSPRAYAQVQATAGLTGVVKTSQGIPVPSATVRAENLASHRAWMSWTDASGKFEFPALPPGRYQVEATMLGFSPASGDVNLPATVANLDLTLQVATLAELAGPARAPEAAARNASAETKPGTTRPAGPRPAEVNDRPGRPGARGGAIPAGVMNAMRSGMGGFQQVDLGTGEATGAEEGQQPTEQVSGPSTVQTTAPLSADALGAAASSDSFLMSGSVGRGVDTLPGANLNVGGFGPGGMGGPGGPMGGPMGGRGGMAGGGPMMGGGPGRFRGRGQRRFGGPGAAAGSVAGLYARRRFLQQSVNRVRFNFFNRYENSIWDARPYALNGVTPAKISHYNEHFGGSVGGPLYLPHIYDGRDRTFFFVNYNLDRQQSPIDSFSSVPTVTERTGNFCDRNAQLYDPTSNLSGPRASLGCQIPSSMLNSAAAGLLKYIPEPNLPGFVQNFHLQGTVPTSSNFVNVHVLHTISSRYSVNGGYNFESSHADTLTNFPAIGGSTLTRNQNVDLSLVQNWSTRLINVTSLNFNRSRIEVLSNNSFVNNVAGDLGITGVSTAPMNYGISQIGYTNFSGLSDPVPNLNRDQTWRLDDAVTYTRGKHTYTSGFELRRIDWNKFGDPIPRGSFTFTGLMTSQLNSQGQAVPGTGLDFADFLIGLAQSTNTRYGSSASYFRGWGYAAYVQDDWRIRPRFSVSYGFRYDYVTPPIELYNAIANLDVNASTGQVAVVIPGEVAPFSGSLPRSLVRGDPNNFAPRVGFAWQPFRNDSTIVRGGYSIFYNESIYQQLAFDMANQPPFAQAQTRLTSPTSVLTLEDGFPPAPPTTAQNTYAIDPNYRIGYAQIWDLSIERRFRDGWMLDAYYTGTKGTHLDFQLAPHNAPPGSSLSGGESQVASGFIYDTFGASSIYHAGHLVVRKRPTHGLMFVGDYGFGKSIDDASTFGGGTAAVVQNDNDFRAERGLSSFDIRQQFRGFTFYQLPFGTRQHWARGGWTERLFGNYRVNAIITANSGTPYTARVLGASTNNAATGASFSLRADQIAGGCAGPGNTGEFFDTAAFVLPPAGQYGDAARNTICGPSQFSLNMGLDRSFVFGQDRLRRLDVRWEVQNLTNTPNFTGLDTVVNSTSYGRVTSVGNMRTMNITVRMSF
ncbi:MAG: TonB-dependent receptor [Acidobacteriota bacterium]|nr:TonB-dependent receptor [Acidobacteriota bacterium]